jgi:hypothetical protein
VAIALVILLASGSQAPAFAAGAGKGGKDKGSPGGARIMVVKRQGHAHCFEGALVLGSVVIAGGRCYTFYLLRTGGGLFLAFGPPGPPMIPPGQIVRMSTPAGKKMKGRLFYLVPVSTPVTIIQVDTIVFAPVVVTPQPGQVMITVPKASVGSAQDRPLEFAFLQR